MFIAPFFIVFAVFGLYPIVYTFILSFQKWDGLAKMTPLGWKNYARLLTDDVFYLSIWNTIRIWIFNFVPQMLTALLLSALFTFNRIRGMKFFRAAYYLPNLITAASVGLLFNLLFDGNKSVANYILQALHTKEVEYKLSYYYIEQFSHYVLPGAKRIAATCYTDKLETVSFVNPDGTLAVVLLNRTEQCMPVTLRVMGSLVACEIEASSMTTIVLN